MSKNETPRIWAVGLGTQEYLAKAQDHTEVAKTVVDRALGGGRGNGVNIVEVTLEDPSRVFPTEDTTIMRVIPGSTVPYPGVGEKPTPAQDKAFRAVGKNASRR